MDISQSAVSHRSIRFVDLCHRRHAECCSGRQGSTDAVALYPYSLARVLQLAPSNTFRPNSYAWTDPRQSDRSNGETKSWRTLSPVSLLQLESGNYQWNWQCLPIQPLRKKGKGESGGCEVNILMPLSIYRTYRAVSCVAHAERHFVRLFLSLGLDCQ
jgi:hypothetical protein